MNHYLMTAKKSCSGWNSMMTKNSNCPKSCSMSYPMNCLSSTSYCWVNYC
ncbi:hypothetical protein TBK1r_44770 [Stieleria magnilauensis]|uniref:ShKT domain-containing protein n=1 Tax=Stieleria magnilauensis TaxID=2527963 RepID=A0ABX5XTW2_9BACT|nr:hypothetical protein TBK1r_44770 [Planctomycetes bacterium TBK1r]